MAAMAAGAAGGGAAAGGAAGGAGGMGGMMGGMSKGGGGKKEKKKDAGVDAIDTTLGKSPNKFVDLTKGARDKVAMAATGGMLGDKSKGTDRDSLMGKK